MPKPTFLKLPDEKRERIVALAIEEFSERPYREASLSRIVARAGIAKGSIYQYFDNKLDLYRWLILEEVPRRKLAHMQERMREQAPGDLAGMLRTMVGAGLRFMLDNPRLSALASAVVSPTSDPELRELFVDARKSGQDGFVAMLRPLQARGELREDVAVEDLGHMISVVLTYGIRELALGRLGVDLYTLFSEPDRAQKLGDAQLDELVDVMVRLVIEGVGGHSTAR